MQLYESWPNEERKTVVMAVLDAGACDMLEPQLLATVKADLEKMWRAIDKPAAFDGKALDSVFDFRYACLPHSTHANSDFELKLDQLKRSALFDQNHLPADRKLVEVEERARVYGKRRNSLKPPAHAELEASAACAQHLNALAQVVADGAAKIAVLDDAKPAAEFAAACDGLLGDVLEQYDAAAEAFGSSKSFVRKRNELMRNVVDALRFVLYLLVYMEQARAGAAAGGFVSRVHPAVQQGSCHFASQAVFESGHSRDCERRYEAL